MICFTSVGIVETVTSTVAWEWHYNWRAKTKNRQKTTHCVDIQMVKILFYIYFDVGQLLWSSLWGYHWHVSYCKYEGGASFLLYDCVSTFYLQPFYSSRKKYKKQKLEGSSLFVMKTKQNVNTWVEEMMRHRHKVDIEENKMLCNRLEQLLLVKYNILWHFIFKWSHSTSGLAYCTLMILSRLKLH